MKRILVIGATSAIAEATERLFAKQGHHLYLMARNSERLEMIAADLRVRGAISVHAKQFDANNFDQHEKIISEAIQTLGGIDIAFIAHGSLSNQKNCEKDSSAMIQEFNTNALSTMSLLTHLANHFESQKRGTIAIITSVAGDRGRQSNYVYCAAKGVVTIFLQGLRQRLYKSSVHVLTIKPGFVDTPMTAHFKKGLLWASPDTIARDIVRGIEKKKNVIYTPSFWRLIMAIVKCVPERIFKRM